MYITRHVEIQIKEASKYYSRDTWYCPISILLLHNEFV